MSNAIMETLHNSLLTVVGFLDRIEEVPESIYEGKKRDASISCKIRSPGKVEVVAVKFDLTKGLHLPKFQGHFVVVPVSLTIFNNKPYYKAFDLPVSLNKEYMAEYPPVSIPLENAA